VLLQNLKAAVNDLYSKYIMKEGVATAGAKEPEIPSEAVGLHRVLTVVTLDPTRAVLPVSLQGLRLMCKQSTPGSASIWSERWTV
jgi:hypothetical protein